MDKKISELLSAFFVNEYLNKLKTKAKEYFANKRYESLEDSYKNVLLEFTKAFCGQGELYGVIYYNRVVQNFHATLYVKNISSEDKFLAFIDKTTLEFLPKNYYDKLGSNYQKKEKIICEILRNSVKDFADFVIKEKIKDILSPKDDSHKRETVLCLKKKMFSILEQKQNAFISAVQLSGQNHSEFTSSIELNKRLVFLEKQVEDLKKKTIQLREEKNAIVRDRNQIVLKLKETSQQLSALRAKNTRPSLTSTPLIPSMPTSISSYSLSSAPLPSSSASSFSLSNDREKKGKEDRESKEKKESGAVKLGIVELPSFSSSLPKGKENDDDDDNIDDKDEDYEFEELEADD